MKKTSIAIIILLLIIIPVLITACQPDEEIQEGVPQETILPSPTPTLPPEQEAIYELWEGSQHADTYALEKGPNTYCARCHSPTNWDYAATVDSPPNCVSCKFAFEPEPRIAAGNPLVPEDEWGSIGCEVCHRMEGRKADSKIGYYDNTSGYYETVASTTELCEKCHFNKAPFLFHKRELGEGAHQGFTCTNCHDPHEPFTSCATSGCHVEVVEERRLVAKHHVNITSKEQCHECHTDNMDKHSMELQYEDTGDCLTCHEYIANLTEANFSAAQHTTAHKSVACVACHDASGLDVGPNEEDNIWTAIRTIENPFGAIPEPYVSHNLTKTVVCSRCHFKDNPWEIAETVDPSN